MCCTHLIRHGTRTYVPSATAKRFGLWDAIIAEPLPDNPDLYPTGMTTARYARGIAFASQGLVAEAEEEQASEESFFANSQLFKSLMNCCGVLGCRGGGEAGECLESRNSSKNVAQSANLGLTAV